MTTDNPINLEKTPAATSPNLSRNLPPLSEETRLLATVAAELYPSVKAEYAGFKKEIIIEQTLAEAESLILAARRRTRNI